MTLKKKHLWTIPYRTPAGRFYNYETERSSPALIASLSMAAQTLFMRVLQTTKKTDMHEWCIPAYQHKVIPDFSITWLGHATFLIKLGGKTIITDPIFGSPSFLFQRLFPFTLLPSHLGQIDCALISHNHYDHLDLPTLKKIAHRGMMVYVPRGDGELLRKHQIKNVYELSWWQSYTVSAGSASNQIVCTFLPAKHWSGRTLLDRNRSLWGSWMIEYDGFTIYFGGDTAYAEHFEQIKERFNHISVALLPIGPVEPREHMSISHMGPEDAGKAFLDLGARVLIPMHWGTYAFGIDQSMTPLIRMNEWWNNHLPQLAGAELKQLKAYETMPLIPEPRIFVSKQFRVEQKSTRSEIKSKE